MMRLAFAVLAAVALAGCDRMDRQSRYDSYEASTLFPEGTSLQTAPDGTVAQDEPFWTAALSERPTMTAELLRRGRERYGIYCVPCHDQAGYGNGVVPSRGFPHPPSFHDARLRDASEAYFVEVITNGHGVMYSYADRVAPSDRWAIAAYIRALQLSQRAPAELLSNDDRNALDRGMP